MALTRKFNYYSAIGLVWFFFGPISCKEKVTNNNYLTYAFTVPKDQNPSEPFAYSYSVQWGENLIKKKNQIKITLDGDQITNQKKLELVKYEARKLKYTTDTTTVIRIILTDETTYGEFLQLIKLCNEDKHKRYALLKRSFVIFGEYPSSSKKTDTTKEIYPIYL